MSTMRVRMSSSVAGGVVVAGRGGAGAAAWALGLASELAAVLFSADRNDAASGGADISRVAKMVLGVAREPYTLVLASSSGLRTPPDRSIPANSPFDREYDRISAVTTAS